jgi:hypothetical protein
MYEYEIELHRSTREWLSRTSGELRRTAALQRSACLEARLESRALIAEARELRARGVRLITSTACAPFRRSMFDEARAA